MAMPAGVRPAISLLLDATAGDLALLPKALRQVIAVTAPYLDQSAVLELEKLAQAFVD